MAKVFLSGIVLGLLVLAVNFALHLLNRSSDVAVAGGYLILLALMSLVVGAISRRRS